MNETRQSRIYGFDFIRLISFFVVAFYHFLYALWRDHFDLYETITGPDMVYRTTVHPFERALASSGHILLFLSMILIALSKKSFKTVLRFSLFLIVAWLLFTWADNDFGPMIPAWDIHPLIFVGLITIVGAEALSPQLVPILGVVGFLITCMRFYDLRPFVDMNLYARSILVGDCAYGVASWPVLPWLGFLYSGYAVGFGLRSQRVREFAKTMSAKEVGAWLVVLAFALIRVGAYYRIQEERWECDAFRLPPVDFYSDFVFVLFAIRLALLSNVNRWFAAHAAWIAKLNVSRNFFLAYALQFTFGFAIATLFGDAIRQSSPLFMWTGVAMLPLAELVAWVAARLGARRLFKGRTSV
jgi:hypothetical protein